MTLASSDLAFRNYATSITGNILDPLTSTSVRLTVSGEISGWSSIPGAASLWSETGYSSAYANVTTNAARIAQTGFTSATYQAHTLTFSSPVSNVLMSIYSLGAPSSVSSLTFSQPFQVLSSTGGSTFVSAGNALTGYTLTGYEGRGVIQFLGDYTSLSWNVTAPEVYSAFNIGMTDTPYYNANTVVPYVFPGGILPPTYSSTPDIVTAGNASGSNVNLASTILSGSSANFNNRFDGGTLKVDAAGTYAGNFSITSSGGTLDQGGVASTFTGVFSNDTTDTSNAARNLTATNSGAAGAGAVTLTAGNTYTGATTVDAGAKLALSGAGSVATSSGVAANGVFDISATTSGASIKSLSGSGSVVTASGKSLSLTNASGTFSGAISGAGGVNLVAGSETLSGTNTYTGATQVNGGTLNLTGSLASTAVTVAGGTLTNANGGLASGTNLTVNSGAVNINANDTIANFNGSGGSVALASGKTLTVSAGGTYAGTLSGAGSVQVTGGTQTLSGSNTHTGGTEVKVLDGATAGTTLSIASASALGTGTLALMGTDTVSATLHTTADMTIANAITVSRDPTFDVASGTTTTISGVIADGSAAGYVTKEGAGTLALTAANTYTGPTTISTGTLTLSGSGSIAGSTAVTNNATLDVTAASGNVAFGGTYAQGANGTLKMNVTADPLTNQRVNTAGAITAGGTLNLNASAGTYRAGRYTLMTSRDSSVSGAFNPLNTSNTNLSSVTNHTYNLAYDANNVYLELRANAADTLASIQAMGTDLNKVYGGQYGIAQLGLSYDCKLFDANDLCLSAGARTTHSRADGSTYDGVALIAAYRAQPDLRLGVWLDQNESRKVASNVTAGNSTPMFGAFAVWNENSQTGEGLEVKLSGAYGQKNLTLTRPEFGTSERGQGNSKLSTLVAEASVGYGVQLNARTRVSPFAGLRHAKLLNTGYTENNVDIFSPLTFAKTSQSATSVMAGVNLFDKPEGPIGLDLSAGVERYVSTSAAQLSATGIDNLSAAQLTPVLSKNRPFASASLRYDLAKNQQLLFGLSHSKQFANSDWVTSATVRYVVGL
jgi:autotransporter-associated beta strand protein